MNERILKATYKVQLKKIIVETFHLYLGEESHKIPVENFDLADGNYRGLWIQLENFVNPNGEKPAYPPLYCLVGLPVSSLFEKFMEWWLNISIIVIIIEATI